MIFAGTSLRLLLFASCLAVSSAAFAQEEGESETTTTEEKPLALDVDRAIDKARDARKTELSKGAYSFCHEDDFEAQPFLGEKRFCRTFDPSSREACPQAERMCKEEKSLFDNMSFALPPWLAWSLLGALLVAVLFAFFRSLQSSGWAKGNEEIDLGALLDEKNLAGEIQALPEAPAMAILRRARQSAQEGRQEEAAVLAQLACLRYFDDNGLVQFHPSRTNGEYLRAIRRHTELAMLYKAVARQTDRLRFGDGRVDAVEVESCLDDAQRLLAQPPLEGFGPIAAATTTLVLLLLGAGCTESPGKPYYSHRPAGLAALPALLREIGLTTEVGRYKFDLLPADTGVVVLRSGASFSGDYDAIQIDALLDRDLAVVILDDLNKAEHFLPVTSTLTSTGAFFAMFTALADIEPASSEVEISEDVFCGVDFAELAEKLPKKALKLPRQHRLKERRPSAKNTDAAIVPSATVAASKHQIALYPLLGSVLEPDGTTSAVAFGGARLAPEEEEEEEDPPSTNLYLPGCVFVFPPDLFTNAGLSFEENAAFVAGLFASLVRQNERVVLLDSLDGGKKADGIARSIADSRLLPLIVHGFLWVGLLFFLVGAAFGPLRDPVHKQHKAFVEHVEAVGRHYAAAGLSGTTHAARALARLVVMRHRHEVRGGDAGWLAVARHLADKHNLKEEDVRAAIRLGVEGTQELGTGAGDILAGSDEMLRTLSALLTGKQRQTQSKRGGRLGALFRRR